MIQPGVFGKPLCCEHHMCGGIVHAAVTSLGLQPVINTAAAVPTKEYCQISSSSLVEHMCSLLSRYVALSVHMTSPEGKILASYHCALQPSEPVPDLGLPVYLVLSGLRLSSNVGAMAPAGAPRRPRD